MDNNYDGSLILRKDVSLEKGTPGPQRILSGMIEKTHALACQEPIFKIGKYEWHEPDYRQIVIWAQSLGMSPEEVVKRIVECGMHRPWRPRVLSPADPGYEHKAEEAMAFASALFKNGPRTERDVLDHFRAQFGNDAEDRLGKVGYRVRKLQPHLLNEIDWRALESQLYFERWEARLGVPADVLSGDVVRNGRIIRLHWDFIQLPIHNFEWVEGLQITCLTFSNLRHSGVGNPVIPLPLPNLRYLSCEALGLTQLDLSKVNDLRRLECGRNQLTVLELSDVAQLTALDCGDNRIVELHLTNVPLLRELNCGDNQLTELDLTQVPQLKSLYCANNQLRELDVSRTTELDWLNCMGNPIDVLDITSLRRVKWVAYDEERTEVIRGPQQEGI